MQQLIVSSSNRQVAGRLTDLFVEAGVQVEVQERRMVLDVSVPDGHDVVVVVEDSEAQLEFLNAWLEQAYACGVMARVNMWLVAVQKHGGGARNLERFSRAYGWMFDTVCDEQRACDDDGCTTLELFVSRVTRREGKFYGPRKRVCQTPLSPLSLASL